VIGLVERKSKHGVRGADIVVQSLHVSRVGRGGGNTMLPMTTRRAQRRIPEFIRKPRSIVPA
jgi:hypothetical protein